jgi:hypothetical protein
MNVLPKDIGGPSFLAEPAQSSYLAPNNSSRLRNFGLAAAFIVLHVPLALAQKTIPMVGVGVECVALLVGIGAALRGRRESLVPLYCVCYIAGSEVLWRAAGVANLTAWEFGKYGVGLIVVVALVFQPRRNLPRIPLLLVFALLPSILLWLPLDAPLALVWRRVFGNLAGPILLGLCALYFSSLQLLRGDLRKIAVIFLATAMGIAALSAQNLLIFGQELDFIGSEERRIASGGGGANQVANALSLAVVFCWFLMWDDGLKRWHRVAVFAFGVGLSVAMVLTLSRGGVGNLLLVVLNTGFLLFRTRRRGLRLILVGSFLAVIALQLAPRVNRLTQGAVDNRFSRGMESSRWALVQSEFQVFLDHPLLGAGPGHARDLVDEYGLGYEMQAHTEFSRLLADHGMFGLLALGLIFAGAWKCYRAAAVQEWRFWVLGLTVFVLAYLSHSATRTVLPSVLYGLIWARVVFPVPVREGLTMERTFR